MTFEQMLQWATTDVWGIPFTSGLAVLIVVGAWKGISKRRASSSKSNASKKARSFDYTGPSFRYQTNKESKNEHSADTGGGAASVKPLPHPSRPVNPAGIHSGALPSGMNSSDSGGSKIHQISDNPGATTPGAWLAKYPVPLSGLQPSRDIANKTIPNRTPRLPANFQFVTNVATTELGLKNEGPGDASSVYLQPQDPANRVIDGGFWPSIPAGHTMPFRLAGSRDFGTIKIRFGLSWDDGYALKREDELHIPGIGD